MNHVDDVAALSRNTPYAQYVDKPCNTYVYNVVQNLKGCYIHAMSMEMYFKQEIP